MNNYPLTREYLALLRYLYRHRFSSLPMTPVDFQWFEQERRTVADLINHDVHPSREEYYQIADEYEITTHFPFVKEEP
jgi:hypothetical protein